MLRKLFPLKPGNNKPDHPLGSDENLARLIDGIPVGEPMRTLQELANWHDDIPRFEPEIGSRALLRASLRLDAVADEARTLLLARYLDPQAREHLSEMALAEIDRSLQHAIGAYRHCLAAQQQTPRVDIDKADIDLAAARAMRAQVMRKKLMRFRYRAADADYWREIFAILSLAGLLRAANVPVSINHNPGEPKRSVLQLFLAGVYFELAPLANLVPQQVEMLDRLLLRVADTLEFAAEAHAASTHWVNLGGTNGPMPLDKQPPAEPMVRYIARGRLRPAVTQIAAELRAREQAPDWLVPTGCPPELVQRLFMVLMLHWAGPPPQRGTERLPAEDKLRVVLGFGLTRRMIAFADFARSGRSFEYKHGDINALFHERRFGQVGSDTEPDPAATAQPLVVDPMEVLEKLELSADRQLIEHWVQTDVSDTGLGAVVSAMRAAHHIGALVCLRHSGGIEWRLGLIRRIGRNAAGQAQLGIETLVGPSTCAQVKPLTQEALDAWAMLPDASHGYLDAGLVPHEFSEQIAILASPNGNELILPHGAFAADLAIRLRVGETVRRVRLIQLVERGDDFDRVRFAASD